MERNNGNRLPREPVFYWLIHREHARGIHVYFCVIIKGTGKKVLHAASEMKIQTANAA